jgi:hypothetical protein
MNFNFLIEFMSAIKQDVNVSVAITFEYLEKSQPEAEEYRDAYLIWNSVGTPQYQKGAYNRASSAWIVPKSGVLLHGMGHMHDGGTHVDLYINNKLACSSRMYYNARPGYGSTLEPRHGHSSQNKNSLAPSDAPSHVAFGGKHISDPGHCTSFGRVEKGDRMHVVAYYNTTEYNVMNHEGKVEEQMGILRVFIGPVDTTSDVIAPDNIVPDNAESENIITVDIESSEVDTSEVEPTEVAPEEV